MSGTPRSPGAPDPEPRDSTELPLTNLSAPAGTVDSDPLLAAIAKTPHGPPPKDLETGSIVGHGFRIERKLGAGGMGVVYLARDMTLDRDVALKVHRAIGGLDRLQREAVAMARLAHPNVITVHEIGRVGQRLFVAMEYVAGQTLRDWLAARRRPWRELVAMMRQVGLGLCAAHDAGLVHRDFKPENVLVGPDGRPRVGDFGLVRVVGNAPSLTTSEIELARAPGYELTEPGETTFSEPAEPADPSLADTIEPPRPATPDTPDTPDTPAPRTATTAPPRPAVRGPDSKTLVPAEISTFEPSEDRDRLTATGAVLGTPAYMAPEQFAGERVDTRADQFAFSVVLYEGLYGQRPFAGHTHGEILRAIEAGRIRVPPPGRRAPRWLRRVIERGLAPFPDQRFPTMAALLDALDRGMRRRARVAAAAAITAAAAIAAAAIVVRPSAAPSAPCAGAGVELDDTWTPAARAHLASAAAEADHQLGPRIADRVSARLDDYRGAYRAAAGRACMARDVDKTWDDDVYHRSRSCLDEGRSLFHHIVGAPLRGRQDLATLVFETSQLPPPDACTRPSSLHTPPFAGGGLVTGAARVAVYDALADLKSSHRGLADRQAAVDHLADVASGLDSPVLDARIAVVRAGIAYGRTDFAAAQEDAERAFQAARGASDDEDAGDAAVMLLRILGVEQSKFEAARPWLLEALGDADRSPWPDEPFTAAAAMAERQGHFDEGIAYARKAVAAIEQQGETATLRYAFAVDQLAATLDEAGHSADAVALYRKAIAVNQQLGGPDNPALFNDYVNVSLALSSVGDPKGAIEAAQRAVELAREWSGVLTTDSAAAAYLNLGAAYLNAQRPADARGALDTARAGYQALPGDQRDSLAIVESDLATAYEDTGEDELALEHIQASLRLFHDAGEDDSLDAASAQVTYGGLLSNQRRCDEAIAAMSDAVAHMKKTAPDDIGWVSGVIGTSPCLRQTRRSAEAIAPLEDALALLAARPHPKYLEGRVRWQLAQDLHALGRDPARAHQLASEARALLVAADATAYAGEITAIDEGVAGWP